MKVLRNMCATCVVVVCFASIAGAQLPPGSEGKTAEQAYKNIQVMQGAPMDLFLPEMRLFEAALGVNCEYCHLEEDRSKDDLQAKQTARKMIAMVREINKNFDGRTVVTCYTCHRGDVEPVGVTMFPSVERTGLNEEEKAKAPAPNYPTVTRTCTPAKWIPASVSKDSFRSTEIKDFVVLFASDHQNTAG